MKRKSEKTFFLTRWSVVPFTVESHRSIERIVQELENVAIREGFPMEIEVAESNMAHFTLWIDPPTTLKTKYSGSIMQGKIYLDSARNINVISGTTLRRSITGKYLTRLLLLMSSMPVCFLSMVVPIQVSDGVPIGTVIIDLAFGLAVIFGIVVIPFIVFEFISELVALRHRRR
ncbi:MAG: hypothetical protein AAF787_21445, partial [Chloroflexota bacterium]